MSMTAYWNIRARLLRVPGVANVAIWGERIEGCTRCRSSPSKLESATRCHPRHGHGGHGELPRLGPAAVHRKLGSSGTAGSSRPRTSASTMRHVLPIASPDDLGEVLVNEQGRQDACASATSRTSCRTTSRWSATPSSTAAQGLMLDRREAAVGQHPRGHRGCREGHRPSSRPDCPACRSTPRSSGRPRFVQQAIDHLTESLHPRRAARGAGARPVPARTGAPR